MAAEQLRTLIRQLRRSVNPASEDALSDAQLLERWTKQRDEAAFEVLLWRHGPMVLAVCRRLLSGSHDIEDAFQATFLTLVRKEGSIRRPAAIAAWLHRIACRIALRLRGDAAMRAQRERPGVETVTVQDTDEAAARDLRAVLDEEIDALPERYRRALLLCDVQGKTHAETARLLGRPPGTVSCWLKRGRERLRGRLLRRGIAPAAALAAVGESQVRGAMSGVLVESTCRAAKVLAAGGEGLGAAISVRVSALVEGALKGVVLTKLKLSLVLAVVVGVAAAGVGVLAHQAAAPNQPPPKQEAKAAAPERPRPQEERPARTDRYGDPLPPGVLARMGTVRFRHGDAIEGISLSPDGRTLAAASRDRTVRLWDMTTGRELRRLPGHEGSVRSVAFSPDGKILATGVSPSRIVRLWDAARGKELRKFQSPHAWLGHVAFSTDGKTVAAVGDRHRMVLWETATGRLLHKLDGGEEKLPFAVPIAFSPDGRMLASGGLGETLRLWNLKSGKEEQRFLVQPPWPKEKSDSDSLTALVEVVAFSPDGRILASAAKDSPVRLWDMATGKEIRSLRGDRYGAFALAFSPDGKTLACGEIGTVRVWETATGKEVRRIQAHKSSVSGLAFVRDGEALVTSGDSAIRLWEIRTGSEILPDRGHASGIVSSVLSPDGRTFVTGSSDGAIRWWDLATGKELRQLVVPVGSSPGAGMVFSPGGTIAAYHKEKIVGEREAQVGIELWDLAARKKLALLWRPSIFGARFSPNGKTLYTSIWDVKQGAGFIISWDATTGKELRTLARATNSYGSLDLSADGKILAAMTWGREKTISLLDAATGKELCEIAGDPYFNQCVAISPDNKLLAVADGVPPQAGGSFPPHYIRLWDIATSKEVRRFGRSKSGYWPVAFSADGRTLATADEDNQIRLWEAATGGERLRLAGHAGRIGSLLFAENGRTLLSTSSDTTALVWDVTGLRRPTPTADGKRTSRNPQDLWNALAESDAATAYRAIWALTASPREAAAFLGEHLRRVEPPDEKVIAKLVLDLDSPVFATRQRASEELSKLDRLAELALRKALTGQPSLETRRRIQSLLEQLASVPSGVQLQPLRAIEALEQIGTPAARQVLETLASGAPNARLTQEAKASLDRLAKKRP